jgi:hypothetical protein
LERLMTQFAVDCRWWVHVCNRRSERLTHIQPCCFWMFQFGICHVSQWEICTTPAANPHNKNNPGLAIEMTKVPHFTNRMTTKIYFKQPNKQKSKYENNTRLTCSSHGKKE